MAGKQNKKIEKEMPIFRIYLQQTCRGSVDNDKKRKPTSITAKVYITSLNSHLTGLGLLYELYSHARASFLVISTRHT
jgi:hypothetical protein